MRDNGRSIERQWYAGCITWQDGVPSIGHDVDYTRQIIQVDQFMYDLARSEGDLFAVTQSRFMRRPTREKTPLGERLLTCLKFDVRSMLDTFSHHKLSPYFKLFADEVLAHEAWSMVLIEDVPRLNLWVSRLRDAAKEEGFAKVVDAHERAARKNAASVRKYIAGLFERHSRLTVVRVDVGLSREYRREHGEPDPRVVKRQLRALLKQIRRNFPATVGYVWKLEHGPAKSYHVHLMLLLNGHEVREDVTIGQLVGNRWKAITDDNGTYWNCNAEKKLYEKLGILGIGVIDYDQLDLRTNLVEAALYLTKVDYYARLNAPGVKRTFGKGVLPKQDAVRRGRPRSRGKARRAPHVANGPLS